MTTLFKAMAPLVSDLASSIFFAALIAVTGNIYLATAVGIAAGILQIVGMKLLRRKVFLMQWMSLGLVIVFGTLTLYLHDPRFVMVKFAIGHVAVGIAMFQRNWMSRYLPDVVTRNLSSGELTFYSAMWPVMMLGLAIASLYVGFVMGPKPWAFFLGVVSPAAPWVLFAIQYLMIRVHVRSIIKKRGGARYPAGMEPAE